MEKWQNEDTNEPGPKGKVLIIGAAIIDVIIKVAELPKSGQDIFGKADQVTVGGCAYNVSSVLKQLCIPHDLLIPVGEGICAKVIREELLKEEYPLLIEEPYDNGWSLCIVEEGGERTFITIPGIETQWREEWFQVIEIETYDYIYISGYELEGPSGYIMTKALEKRKKEAKLIFDPSPRINFIDESVIKKVLTKGTIVHSNKAELLCLTSESSVEDGARAIFDKTAEPVIITLGAEGTFFYTEEESDLIPSEPALVVDTIGAGDSHLACFIAGLAVNLSLREACAVGNGIARLVVQQSGSKLVL